MTSTLQKVTVRVPATSANLGPGFDSFGLALALYNEISIVSGAGVAPVVVRSADAASLPAGAENIASIAAHKLLDGIGDGKPFHLEMRNEIPLSRGLGSSAAARVGALVAANEWARLQGWRCASPQQLLDLATELEGHPDNAAAALLGGFTVSALGEDSGAGGRAHALRVPLQRPPVFLVFSPDGELATKQARAVLPATVSHTDAVFNLSRAGLLLASLVTGEHAAIGEALKDRLHQSQRSALVPGWDKIGAAVTGAGAYGMTLSGAGSSLLVWLPPGDEALTVRVSTAITATAAAIEVKGVLRALAIDDAGAVVMTNGSS